MEQSIFNLDFSRWEAILLCFFPGLVNIAIFVYSYSFPKSRINNFFSIFVLLLALWQFSDGCIRISISADVAMQWSRISLKFLLFVIPFGILFMLRFSQWHKIISSKLTFVLLFVPTIFFYFILEAKQEQDKVVYSDYIYWVVNPQPTVITGLLYGWLSLVALVLLSLVWIYYWKSKENKPERRKALLIASGLTLPILGGIVAEVILPMLFKYDDIPLATPLMSVFSLNALVVIRKHNMLNYSPKHQWAQILESIKEGVLIVNNANEIMYANNAFCKLLGYEFEEIKGKLANKVFDIKTVKTLDDSNDDVGPYITGRQEVEMVTKAGRHIWVIIGNTPYTNEKGKVVGSISLHTDISNLKAANQELETFIYKASHDLRGPLTSIIGLMNISRMEVTDETAIKYLGMVEQAVQKLDGTLVDLVKAMQIMDQGNVKNEINFETIIEDILNKFKNFPGYSRMNIHLHVTQSGQFLSSKFIVETIMQNLIENAIKYQNPGAKEPFLNIDISGSPHEVYILVRDNGIGIDRGSQDKVFDMYYRASNVSRGTGLGLYLVEKAVKKLNGKIELESESGKGTIFTVYLQGEAA
ncbi:MAG: PAS domain S-box protein [Bacteroidetes bacterium]|nr:PAS domain S-box protein [Bacteroidota bacterium]